MKAHRKTAIALALFLALGASAQVPPGGIAMSPAAKRALVEKAMTVRVGDTREAVIERLGKPTIDLTTSAAGGVVARSLKYIVRASSSSRSALDEHIDIYIGKNNRVDGIYFNVELK